MVGLDKGSRTPSSTVDTQPPAALSQAVAPALSSACYTAPAACVLLRLQQYKHWAAAPAREGVMWKSFRDSVTLWVEAQKPGRLPRWGGKCGDARGARPRKAQAGVWPRVRLRSRGEKASELVGIKRSLGI